MSAELWMMSATESDHDVTLTLPGDAESLRPRLIEAVERLGYKVITEEPLQVKRPAQGAARWDCSFNALDYPRKLTIALKPLNEQATIARFSYEVKAYTCLTRGERQTLLCEAEALAALAMQRVYVTSCNACGMEATDDSRFCRKCGAPFVVEVAEMEVLRLMSGTRAGFRNFMIGFGVLLVAALLPLFLIWINTSKGFKVIMILMAIIGAMGLPLLLMGMWQVYRTLNPAETKKVSTESGKSFAAPQSFALPPRPAQLSVTEGTTELLSPEEMKRVPVVVEKKRVDTAEVR